MNPKIVIRSETDADVSAITEVTVAAFKTLEISNHTEQFITEALRAAKALKAAVSWGIRITTGNSGSRTCRDLCMRECHRRSSSLCLSTGILRRAPSLSTTDSKRMANKRVQATLYSAADPYVKHS